MKVLNEFIIPVKGLLEGVHNLTFKVDHEFFTTFDNHDFKKAEFDVKLMFDKRSNFYVTEFEISGTYHTPCDRCGAAIDLPIENRYNIIFKLTEEELEDEAEVVYLSPVIESLNVATYVYEFILLSIPMIKTYDCEDTSPVPCDIQALDTLDQAMEPEEEENENPIWDNLKGLLEN